MLKKATVEWRDLYGDGGRLSLWTEYEVGAALYSDVLADSPITVFKDEHTGTFVGLETDTPEAVPIHAELLHAQPYPHVDLLQAGLIDLHPADALLWGFQHLVPQPQTGGERVASTGAAHLGRALTPDERTFLREYSEGLRARLGADYDTPEAEMERLRTLPARRAEVNAKMPSLEQRRRDIARLRARYGLEEESNS